MFSQFFTREMSELYLRKSTFRLIISVLNVIYFYTIINESKRLLMNFSTFEKKIKNPTASGFLQYQPKSGFQEETALFFQAEKQTACRNNHMNKRQQ